MELIGEEDAHFHILMKLGLTKIMGISYSPPVQELSQTEKLLDKMNEHILNSTLMDAYYQLSKTLKNDIELLINRGRKIDLFIPPVPAILLNKVSKPEEIGEELLNMRRQFSKARENFREYMEKIQDDNSTLRQSLNASKSLGKQLKELTRPYDKRDITSMVHWDDLIDIIPENLTEVSLERLTIKEILKTLGIPLKLIINKIKMRNVVHLFRLKKEFLEICNYNNLVRKVFGRTFEVEY
jgi:hypothetical protein